MNAAIYQYKVNRLDGTEVSLGAYRDKVLLLVNTAGRCGFKPQYKGLESLYASVINPEDLISAKKAYFDPP